jgi:FkbM family methyltransferase
MKTPKTTMFNRTLLKQYLPENPVVVEAGAHKGRDTIKMAQLWPHGHIHAFEPVPHVFEILVENTKQFNNITCYNMALSDQTGSMSMYVSMELDTVSSLLKPTQVLVEKPHISFIRQEVKTITLDDWAKQYSIDHIDFLWLDMQGYELNALKAAPHILKTVRAMYTEVSLEARYEHNPLYPELREWLEKHGFNVELEHFHHQSWGSVLFIRDLSLSQ